MSAMSPAHLLNLDKPVFTFKPKTEDANKKKVSHRASQHSGNLSHLIEIPAIPAEVLRCLS
jgi:hypothetical protein